MKFSSLRGRTKFALYYLILITSILILSIYAVSPFWEPAYLVRCVIIGVGIGIDVAIITLSLASKLNNWDKRLLWCMRVSVWHTTLPMFGLLLFLSFALSGAGLNYSIGIAGALLLLYLYYSFFSSEQDEPEEITVREFVLILSVSLDSFLVGPSLIANTENWSALQMCVSYLLSGLVVGLVASFFAFIGSIIKPDKGKSIIKAGRFLEHLIISYFAWFAILVHGLGFELSRFFVLALVLVLTSILFGAFKRN